VKVTKMIVSTHTQLVQTKFNMGTHRRGNYHLSFFASWLIARFNVLV